MTSSSAANRSPDSVAVRVDVIERDVDPLGRVTAVVRTERPQLASLAERVNRLTREPEQPSCAARRDEPTAVLVEQRDQLRIAARPIRLRHCRTIVAQGSAPGPVPPRSPRA